MSQSIRRIHVLCLLFCYVDVVLTFSSISSHDLIVHVDGSIESDDRSRSDGSRSRPFKTLDEAKRFLIRLRNVNDDTVSNTILSSNVIVRIYPGEYGPLSIDHPALSFVSWEGSLNSDTAAAAAASTRRPIVSGGIEVPNERFELDPTTQTFVASLDGLGADDLGNMVHGDCVDDCQHDKVGVTFGGEPMILARWPNAPANVKSPKTWTNVGACSDNGFFMNLDENPEATRMLRWADEEHPYVHGYWSWDWADCYGRVLNVTREDDGNSVHLLYADTLPSCKTGARFMGVNLLCELDAPGEYYIDQTNRRLYLLPPEGELLNDTTKKIKLQYQYSGVINVTADAKHVRLANLDVRDGRHVGVLAVNTINLTIDNLVVHGHGTNGIDVSNATNCTLRRSQVFDVGCTGIRATAGDAETLRSGNMQILDNVVRNYATWKRSYQPGIFWGGVENVFRGNNVSYGPHNGFLGGGDFADGVNNLFEENRISDCTFDTIDSGGFYTCGQRGAAFTNRGNVLRKNVFERIFNTAGLGVQVASNQAVYLDDQMSAWLVENNTFIDCQIALFVGGGRRNVFRGNRMVRCGTVFYLNNQGMYGNFDNPTVNCTTVAPPFNTTCSTGAAIWMATHSPAASVWSSTWPEMLSIRSNYLGYPAFTELSNSTYCCSKNATICELLSSNTNMAEAESWKVSFQNNKKTDAC